MPKVCHFYAEIKTLVFSEAYVKKEKYVLMSFCQKKAISCIPYATKNYIKLTSNYYTNKISKQFP